MDNIEVLKLIPAEKWFARFKEDNNTITHCRVAALAWVKVYRENNTTTHDDSYEVLTGIDTDGEPSIISSNYCGLIHYDDLTPEEKLQTSYIQG